MTRAYGGLALFDAAVWTGGYALVHGLGLADRLGRRRAAGLAFVAGWAATGLALSLAASAGVPLEPATTLLATLAVGAAGLVCSRFFRRDAPAEIAAPAGRLERAAAYGGLALVGFALLAALVRAAVAGADDSWDSWAFWLPRADGIYVFHGLDTGPSGFGAWAHPEYPPLFPIMAASAYGLAGGIHPSLMPLQLCLLGVSFVAAVAAALRPVVRGWILYPSLAMLCLAPEFWGRLATVLPDQPVAYLLALSALGCTLSVLERRPAWLALAVVLLGAAALTKDEGLMLGLLLAVLAIAASLAARGRAALPALVLLLGPAAFLPWRHWLVAHHLPTANGDYRLRDALDPGFLAGRTARLEYAAGHLARDLFSWSDWTLVLPLALVAAVLAARTAPAASAALSAWLLLGFAGLLVTYWIGRPEIHWYVATSASRVLATLPLVAGTLTPLLLGLALGPRDRST